MATVKASVAAAVEKADRGDPEKRDPVTYYDGIITAYEREFEKWETRAKNVVQRYRDEERAKKENSRKKFSILWSNVQMLTPAVFSRLPQPDVSRRHRDQDPVGRVASLILERALEFEVGNYPDYKQTGKQCVQDRFLPGRATAWVRYEPHFKASSDTPVNGAQVSDDVKAPGEELDYECAPVDYVAWKDFGHNVARTWEEVFVVWREVYMSREACIERFGEEKGKKIPLDAVPEEKKSNLTENDRQYRALVYEIWDKNEKKAFWMSRSKTETPKTMLDERDDPLGMQEFFPCPKPLYATTTNETLIPVPDFAMYQDQAIELDTLSDRIDGLIDMLKVMGTYDGSIPELKRLFTEGVNGTLIPVKNYLAYSEKKGLAGGTDIFDLKPIYEALRVAFEVMAAIIEHIYQITGISDIVRGQSSASETLGAQQIKQNFVGLRLRSMQMEVAQFFTEMLQLKAQIICNKFSPQTIMTIAAVNTLAPADQEFIPQAMELLIGPERMADPSADSGQNPMRTFRIEVNADSLVQMDEKGEQDATQELLVGLGTFLMQAAQVAAAAPELVPFFIETLKWSLSKYKAGKTLEGTLDAALEQLKAKAANPPPPPPDPKMELEKFKAETEAKLMQMEAQIKQAEFGMDMQKMQREEQHDQIEFGMEQQRMQAEGQHDQAELAMDGQRIQMEGRQMQMDEQHQRRQGDMKTQQMQAQHQQKMKQAKQQPKPRTQ